MLEIAENNKDTVSLISATPIELKYMPLWMSEINQVKIEWKNTTKSIPILLERTYPFKSLKEEIIKPLEANKIITLSEKTFSSIIVFLNSVEQITKLIKDCNINKEDCKIICGDSLKNDLKISGIKRYRVKDKFRYLFITKSGFSGMDIESEDAMTVVVSNTSREWQMVDILTDLKQAVSRQRLKSNPNYGHYIYIYNQSIFEYSEEELINKLETKRDRIQKGINIYENAKITGNKEGFMVNADFTAYTIYNKDRDEYILNKSAFNADMYYILETKKQYTKGFDIKGTFDEVLEVQKVDLPVSTTFFRFSGIFLIRIMLKEKLIGVSILTKLNG